MHLSIIVPAYNEEKRLPKTLREIYAYLRTQPYTSEIIVVSDGSKDKTVEVAESMIKEIPALKVIGNKENRGKGYVVKTGMLNAIGDYRIFTDADNSTSIDHIGKLLPELERGVPVVIGTRDSRDDKDAKQAHSQPFYRRFIGDIFNLMVQFILGLWGIWDTQCGFKGMSKEAAETIFNKCLIDRFAFDPEIIVIARKAGYPIKKVPVYWINDPDSRVKPKHMIEMAKDLMKIRINLMTGKYGAK
ncbi:MAG: dolichyl-phosphate beta-glucosyltransferase [bacterium]